MLKSVEMCVELRLRARTLYLLNQNNALKTKDQKGCRRTFPNKGTKEQHRKAKFFKHTL